MAKESSFDIVSTVDMQEIDNAFQQAKKETRAALRPERLGRRDHPRQGGQVHDGGGTRRFRGQAGHRRDRLEARSPRHRSCRCAVADPEAAAGQSVRQKATIVEGIEKDVASKINKDIKAEKFKVKVQIEGDKLRVSSPSRDALQEVIAFLKGKDYGQPLQFVNYR